MNKDHIKTLANDKVVREIAIILHKKLCRHNHVDGCGWDYEDWTERLWYARPDYLKRAERIVLMLEDNGIARENIDIGMLKKMFEYATTYSR